MLKFLKRVSLTLLILAIVGPLKILISALVIAGVMAWHAAKETAADIAEIWRAP